MPTRLTPRIILAGLVGSAALAGAAAGAAEAASAQVQYSGAEIYFDPLVSASGWSLTVTGPDGFVLERWDSSPPSISVFDAHGHALPDGSYSYNLQPEYLLSSSFLQSSSEETSEGRGYAVRDGQNVYQLPAVSGSFTIAGGSIVVPQLEPQSTTGGGTRTSAQSTTTTAATPLQTIPQDLSVQGSICAGFDCSTSENFGFDTIRLKENNLRIAARDTSTGSFPTVDWQLTFNDSTNGGMNKFSIDDIDNGKTPFLIEANSPTNALYVDSTGNVGFGTNAPTVEMHVVDGDTPTLRLAQDGSSGFSPQTWDVAGNETNFFVRDVTNGSKIPFKILPGAPSNSLVVKGDGRVGINTLSPDAPLEIQTSAATIGVGNAAIKIVNTAGPVALQFDPFDNGTFWQFGVPTDDLFRISRSGTGAKELELNSAGDLSIRGDLTINGTCTGCDGMFRSDYPLESLEEHAAFMWENSFLPDVGPTPDGSTSMQVFRRTSGILKELEKAHIYIAQLNDSLKRKDAELAELRERLARIEELLGRE